jgi:tRNA threonylcarbamoyladenosine biosynthesis protein TsaE
MDAPGTITRASDIDELPVITDGPEETMALAGTIAERIEPPLVIGLYGDLGAGKTQFVKGFCAGVGIAPERVTSPTFTIANEYQGRYPIYHLDAYRIGDLDELYEFGYEKYFFGEGVCLIEWADRVEQLVPEDALRLLFEHVDRDQRRISVGRSERLNV